MRAYRLYLIRHGITQGNLNGQYIGSTDLPLCEFGKHQLADLKQHMLYPTVGRVYSSPMKRCTESAEILFPGMLPVLIDDLRECDFGKFEGKTIQELKNTIDYQNWISSNMRISPPNGESQRAFMQRIFDGLQEILADMMHNRISEAALVCHGGVLLNLLFAFASPKRDPAQWTMEPGFGYALQFDPALWSRANIMEVVSPLPWTRGTGDDSAEA